MTHYIIAGGPFAKAVAARKFTVPYYDRVEETEITRKKRKVTYTCPSCDDKLWGKPDMQPHCGKCGLIAFVASYDTNRIAMAA
jgi:ribosomal protein S27AE